LLARLRSLASSLKPSEAWSREAAIRALLQSDFSATFVRVLAYIGALALLALSAAEIIRPTSSGMSIEPAPQVEWINVAKPFPAFHLAMPELAESGYAYGMRRHVSGGGRQDIMTWGELVGEAPHLLLEVYRPAAEFTRFARPEQEIAERTDGVVSATGMKPAGSVESKFGPVSLVAFAVKQDPLRHCLGFVRAFEQPHVQILGWYCSSGSEPIESELVACAIDRLTLVAAASDAKVSELFSRAELKRHFCGQRSHLLTATPKLGPRAPVPDSKLRGRLSAR
jgi:hypothetical protein